VYKLFRSAVHIHSLLCEQQIFYLKAAFESKWVKQMLSATCLYTIDIKRVLSTVSIHINTLIKIQTECHESIKPIFMLHKAN